MRRHDREVTDPAAILAIIEAADSCRLGLIDDSGPLPLPYIVALNYGYEPRGTDGLRGVFWFHAAREGRKLDLISRSSHAAIQLDTEHLPVKNALGCGWGMKYASVIASGRARIVDDIDQRHHGIECLMAHYVRLWGPPEPAPPLAAASMANDCATLPIDDKVLAATTVFRVDVESLSAKRKP